MIINTILLVSVTIILLLRYLKQLTMNTIGLRLSLLGISGLAVLAGTYRLPCLQKGGR